LTTPQVAKEEFEMIGVYLVVWAFTLIVGFYFGYRVGKWFGRRPLKGNRKTKIV